MGVSQSVLLCTKAAAMVEWGPNGDVVFVFTTSTWSCEVGQIQQWFFCLLCNSPRLAARMRA